MPVPRQATLLSHCALVVALAMLGACNDEQARDARSGTANDPEGLDAVGGDITGLRPVLELSYDGDPETSCSTSAPTPSTSPSSSPTSSPTYFPTSSPTYFPTSSPTFQPTSHPTGASTGLSLADAPPPSCRLVVCIVKVDEADVLAGSRAQCESLGKTVQAPDVFKTIELKEGVLDLPLVPDGCDKVTVYMTGHGNDLAGDAYAGVVQTCANAFLDQMKDGDVTWVESGCAGLRPDRLRQVIDNYAGKCRGNLSLKGNQCIAAVAQRTGTTYFGSPIGVQCPRGKRPKVEYPPAAEIIGKPCLEKTKYVYYKEDDGSVKAASCCYDKSAQRLPGVDLDVRWRFEKGDTCKPDAEECDILESAARMYSEVPGYATCATEGFRRFQCPNNKTIDCCKAQGRKLNQNSALPDSDGYLAFSPCPAPPADTTTPPVKQPTTQPPAQPSKPDGAQVRAGKGSKPAKLPGVKKPVTKNPVAKTKPVAKKPATKPVVKLGKKK